MTERLPPFQGPTGAASWKQSAVLLDSHESRPQETPSPTFEGLMLAQASFV